MIEDLGNQIRKIRNEKGLSQKRFGEKVGISGKSISAYETGKVVPPIIILEKITSIYQTTIKTPNLKTREKFLHGLGNIQKQIKDLENSLQELE